MITIHEREDPEFKEEEIEVNKKGGKGLGLSIVGFTSGKGAYIHQIVRHCTKLCLRSGH